MKRAAEGPHEMGSAHISLNQQARLIFFLSTVKELGLSSLKQSFSNKNPHLFLILAVNGAERGTEKLGGIDTSTKMREIYTASRTKSAACAKHSKTREKANQFCSTILPLCG